MKTTIAFLVVAVALAGAASGQTAVKLKKSEGKIAVYLGDELFTEYLYGKDRSKPVLYPIHGPDGVPMTRNYPFKEVDGEAKDHPHHESLWFTHGDVNGISFWHLGKNTGRIVHKELVREFGNGFETENEWIGPNKKVVCTDQTSYAFHTLADGARAVDIRVNIHASHGDVKFGDTKEGTMGIRTHPNLRLSNNKEVKTANGKAVNSEGGTGKGIWGKNAAWVDYWGKIDGKEVGVAIFDHPSNPRHPTTWHARDYGLVAANPFGLNNFQGKGKGAGDMLIKNGDDVTFRYRFVFHRGSAESAKVKALYGEWAAKK